MPDDPIKHVIVLMLENRSFDHMLGGLSKVIPDLDGVPTDGSVRSNTDPDGKSYNQIGGAALTLRYDPKHELQHVLNQLRDVNTGFVDDFARAYPLSQQSDRAEVMKFHAEGALPALHTLAKSFAVCDRWFSSLPGPTWPNRLFAHSGTSLGRVSMPEGILDANLHWYDQTTLYDRLNEKKDITWRIYYGDIPQSLILVHQLEPENAKNYSKLQKLFSDVAGDESSFPSYAFIEPPYYQPGAADDPPPHNLLEGERLIADVYNSLRRNDALWKTSLLVVLYDEHGGFYDHVVPPQTIPPDHHVEEYGFTQFGVRVPAILVSPFVKKEVIHTQFDHTSLLKYLSEKWSLGPLSARVAAANSIGPNILPDVQDLRPATIPEPTALVGEQTYGRLQSRIQPVLNGHQSALVAMTQLLESMTDVEAHSTQGRIKRLITGFDGAVDVAVERVEDFLGQQRQVPSAQIRPASR